jgi:hypothetical protein
MKTCAYCGTQWEGEAPVCKEQGTSLPRTWSCSEGEAEAAAPSDRGRSPYDPDAIRERTDRAYQAAAPSDAGLRTLARYAMVGDLNNRHMDARPDGEYVRLADVLALARQAEAAAPSDAGLRERIDVVLNEVSFRDATNGRRLAYAAFSGTGIVRRIEAALARQGTES